MPKPRYNQKINLTIQNLGLHGEGIGYWHGWTVFVDDALPGEVIHARVTQKERKFGRARVTQMITPSPDRAVPPCPIFGQCGGCQIMHLGYDQQLAFKRERIVKAFGRYETLRGLEIAPCLPSPRPLGYRNKIQLPVRSNDAGMKIGLYARNSHDLIEVGRCYVHCDLGEAVFQQIRPLISKYPILPYEPATGEGELRFVLIKTAVNTGEVLVTFVVRRYDHATMSDLAREILDSVEGVKGVVLNLNESPDNTVLGETFLCLAGSSSIKETIGGLTFKVSPASFFQINPFQAEVLYRKAIEYSDATPQDLILDAYCGVGTLALLAAKQAQRVIGVECVPEAIADAKENAALNGIHNAEFICDTSENALKGIEKADIAFLNPPRKGCEADVIAALAKIKPKTIVYVSCDPETLARDLSLLSSAGYQAEAVQPLDMFPQTAHVETVVKLRFSSLGVGGDHNDLVKRMDHKEP